jgi:tetratricopeptide (TPR) repeat protein
MMLRFCSLGLALLLGLLAKAPATAEDDAAICASARGEQSVAACARLIEGGKQKGAALAKLYSNRCAAWNQQHEPDRALADCSEAIGLDPQLVAARIGRGDSWKLKREFDRAIADYNEAIRLDPNSAAALAGRCSAFSSNREYDSGLPDCNAAIRLDPKSAPAFATRCFILHNKGSQNQASADCEEAIRIDPKYPPGYAARGFLLRSKGDVDRALADLNEAIRLDPKYATAYTTRGFIWNDKRDYDRAISDYNESIRLEPNYGTAYGNRCWALYYKREFDRALKDCDQAINLNFKRAWLFNTRGLIWTEKRDYERAISDFDEAIRMDAKYSIAHYNRARAWGRRSDFDRAIADYSEAIRLNAQYADAYVQRGYAYRQKRDYDHALADFDQALRIKSNNPLAHYARGVTWLDKREYDRAITEFDEAIRLDPKYHSAFTNRGLAFERKGDTDRARKDFEAALALPEAHSSGNGKWAHETARERLAALSNAQRASPTEANGADNSGTRPAVRTTIERGPRVALVIGNTNYADADPALKQPRKDARAVADELKHLGFDVEFAENLTKHGLREALEKFKKKIRPQSTALLFFSGFGIQANRQSFILPVDAQIWTEADIVRDGTNLDAILAEMNSQGAAVKLAVIDAARRNPYERRLRSAAAGLAPVNIGKDTLVIYSAGIGQVFNESAGEQSLFMTEFLKELRSPGISADEVFTRARIGVSRASDAEQVPWVASSLVESFYFMPSGRPSAERQR